MNVASLNCKMLKQILQHLQMIIFEDNPEAFADDFNKLICKLNEIASNPIDRLRGLKQIEVYVKYTKKNCAYSNPDAGRFVDCTTRHRNRDVRFRFQ